jgi:hypothetical protein
MYNIKKGKERKEKKRKEKRGMTLSIKFINPQKTCEGLALKQVHSLLDVMRLLGEAVTGGMDSGG